MKNRPVFLGLVLIVLLLVLGVWVLSFFRSTLVTKRIPGERAAVPQTLAAGDAATETKFVAPTDQVTFHPPRPEDAPEDIRAEVMIGYKIMTETKKYAGEYVNNDLSCTNCHFDGGRSLNTISLVGVGAVYPQYRSRQDYTTDLAMRTQDCFQRSMNGTAPPLDSQVMQSLLVYMQWISKGLPIYAELPWKLPSSLDSKHKPDADAGAKVYQDVCAPCHGANGLGTAAAPPLWGDGSFNDGAGMHRVSTLSVFAFRFMPKNAPCLTEEQALDVAAFVTSKPRPHLESGHSDKITLTIPMSEGK